MRISPCAGALASATRVGYDSLRKTESEQFSQSNAMKTMHAILLIGLCCCVGCNSEPDVPEVDIPYDAKLPRVMELRIVADDRHSAIIGWARKQQTQETEDKKPWTDLVIAPESKNPAARWVDVEQHAEATLLLDGKLIVREKPGVPARKQVLVILDPYNVTSDYLKRTRPGLDEMERPVVFFTLTGKGAERFEKLTSSNLPEMGTYRLLGIIIEDELHSAPRIHSTISEQGQISGNFTEEEADRIAKLMMVGRAPTK